MRRSFVRAGVLAAVIVLLIAAAVAGTYWHGTQGARPLVAGDTIRLASGLEFSVQKGWMGVYSRRQPDVPFLSQGSETLTLRSRDASGDVESVIAHDSFGGPLAVQATSRTVTITRSGQFVLVETTLPGNSDGYVSFGSSHGDVMTLFDGFWASVRLGSSPAR